VTSHDDNHSRTVTPQLRKCAGIGLIEVMVSVMLLSFGFLVVAQMQLQGIRTSQSAFRMSQASYMATQMMDKISRNSDGLLAGHYDNLETSASATEPTCASSGCTPGQSAELDLYEWSAHLHDLRGLNNFVPLIPPDLAGNPPIASVTAGANGVYNVSVSWAEMRGDTEEARDLTVEFIP